MSTAQLPPSEDRDEQREVSDLTVPPTITTADTAPMRSARDRATFASSAALNPASLVGSYFHKLENGQIEWAGQVVGEPTTGRYLCQMENCLPGARRANVQRLIDIDRMLTFDDGYEWRFYDSADAMREAFAEYEVSAHESEFGE